ncbi:MAG TPA: acyl carrier protein, partial [Bacteroidales bacterium]|nr:acyl carrier protein [Bacteroidales bacterium]
LELVILLEREYGIRLEDPKANKEIFKSVRTMAEFIEKNRKM